MIRTALICNLIWLLALAYAVAWGYVTFHNPLAN